MIQEWIVYIVVALCVVWAAVMILRGLRPKRNAACGGCPLSEACNGRPRKAKCKSAQNGAGALPKR